MKRKIFSREKIQHFIRSMKKMLHTDQLIHSNYLHRSSAEKVSLTRSVKLIPIIFHGSASVRMTHLFSFISLLLRNAHVPKLPLSCRKKKDTCVLEECDASRFQGTRFWREERLPSTRIVLLSSIGFSLFKGSDGSSLIILSELFYLPFSLGKTLFYGFLSAERAARGKLSIFVVKTRLMFPLSSSINCFSRFPLKSALRGNTPFSAIPKIGRKLRASFFSGIYLHQAKS